MGFLLLRNRAAFVIRLQILRPPCGLPCSFYFCSWNIHCHALRWNAFWICIHMGRDLELVLLRCTGALFSRWKSNFAGPVQRQITSGRVAHPLARSTPFVSRWFLSGRLPSKTPQGRKKLAQGASPGKKTTARSAYLSAEGAFSSTRRGPPRRETFSFMLWNFPAESGV